jgi:hypothetical protein
MNWMNNPYIMQLLMQRQQQQGQNPNNGLFSMFMNKQPMQGGFMPNQNIVNPIRQPLPMPAQPIPMQSQGMPMQQTLPVAQMPANQANTMPGFSRFPDFQQRFRK